MKKTSSDTDQRDRNLSLAIQHATILQTRKDVQAKILEAIEELIDFPTSPNSDPAHPSPSDLAAFQAHIALFRISDYEAVIEERNAVHKCGYVFCPRPVQPHPADGLGGDRSRLVGRGRDLAVVPSSQVQRWCGKECLKRAMYIQIQLHHDPAWQRPRRFSKGVVLWRERDNSSSSSSSLNDKMGRMSLDDRATEEKLRQAMTQLAMERGDLATGSPSVAGAITVRENQQIAQSNPSSASEQDASNHMSVEGYTPQTSSSNAERKHNDNDNDDDDWNLI